MEQKTKDNLELAVSNCLDNIAASDTPEEACKLLNSAIEGYKVLRDEDLKEQERIEKEKEKKDLKKKILTWAGGILTVLLPAIVVEGMQERFMDKQANKAYEFEKTGTLTTTPGRNFIGGMFKPRTKR